MDSKTLVREFKRENYGTTKPNELADDWGVRIRQTQECKRRSTDVFEVSGSYFYESQEGTSHIIKALNEFAIQHDMVVIQEYDYVRFHGADWPKTSWASVFVKIQ